MYQKKTATSALNEDDYINELYDTNLREQNKTLEEHYRDNGMALNNQQEALGQQTGEYSQRADIEAEKALNLYDDSGLSAGAMAQTALVRDNAQKKNTNILRTAREEAEAEISRQRALLAKQYEADIRKAQADNDMERAQALYEAAKAEEEQLRELQKQGAELLYRKKGDSSLYDDIAQGKDPVRDNAMGTWEGVLENEEALNEIYDAKLESLEQELKSEYETGLSNLEAQREKQLRETDEKLTESYAAALKSRKNYAETQGTRGQGSGTAAGAYLARDTGDLETLTRLRAGQIGADAALDQQGFAAGKAYRDALQEGLHDTDLERAKALYDAAEKEEQDRIEDQLFVGQHRAKKGDYSVLGNLYGLTPEQTDKLNRKEKPAAAGPGGIDVAGEYMRLKKNGASTRDLDEYLKYMIRQGHIDNRGATELRGEHW